MSIEVTAVQLRSLLEEKHPGRRHTYADLFALGCYLHLGGHQEAGRKLVKEVLDSVQSHGNITYLASVLDTLGGNEKRYAAGIHAHAEVNELFR